MATKLYCDACENEVTGAEAGTFVIVLTNFSSKDGRPEPKRWDLCKTCAIAVKQKVIELMNDARKK